MEYKELTEKILKKKDEMDKLCSDYHSMCDKFYKDRDAMNAELKNLFIAYITKPNAKIIGRCFKYEFESGVCYYKILDTAYEDQFAIGMCAPFKTLVAMTDSLNGDHITIQKRKEIDIKQILFGNNEITTEEFERALNGIIENFRNA